MDSIDVPQEAAHTVPEIVAKAHHKPLEGESLAKAFRMDEVETERFMEEPVTIHVTEFPEDSGIIGIPVTVNDTTQYVMGGKTQVVKRKYVEVLARARTTVYKQFNNPQNPAESRPIPRTSLSYPFAIVNDTPKGHAWFKELMAQPG